MEPDTFMSHYHNFRAAVLEMAQANGCINRAESTNALLLRVDNCVARSRMHYTDIETLDMWLGKLTPEQLSNLVDGEQMESNDIAATSPIGSNGDCVALIFEVIFEVI